MARQSPEEESECTAVGKSLSLLGQRVDTAQRLCSLLAQNASIVHPAQGQFPKPNPNPNPTQGVTTNVGPTPSPPQNAWIQRNVLTPVPLNLSLGAGKASPVAEEDISAGNCQGDSSSQQVKSLEAEVARLNNVIADVTRVNDDFHKSTEALMQAKSAVEEELAETREALAEAHAKIQSNEAIRQKQEEEAGRHGLALEGREEKRKDTEEKQRLLAELSVTQSRLHKLHALVKDERALNADLQHSASKVADRNEQLEQMVDQLEGELRMMERPPSTTKGDMQLADMATPGPLAYGSPVVTPVANYRPASPLYRADTATQTPDVYKQKSAMPVHNEKTILSLTPSHLTEKQSGEGAVEDPRGDLNRSFLSVSPGGQRTRLRVDGNTGMIDIDMSPRREPVAVSALTSPKAQELSPPPSRLKRITQSLDSEFKDAEDLTNKLSDELHQ